MTTITKKIGDSLNWTCEYKDASGNPIDLTNIDIKSQARLQKDDDVVLFDLSIGSGITITDAPNGLYTMLVINTLSYTRDTFDVDIQFLDAQSIVLSTETFELKMIKGVTE